MSILIQKHRRVAVYKFCDGDRRYLGIILGDKKENMPALALKIAKVLKGLSVTGFTKSFRDNGDIDIDLKGKRVGGFLKGSFITVSSAIEKQITV